MARSARSASGADEADPIALSLVRGDPGFRLQRRLGLVPAEGLGVARRAVVLAGITWLPIAIWAVVTGHAWSGPGEPLLQHYGITVRCLLAIPLLVVAEASAHATTLRLLPHFLDSGLVPAPEQDRFAAIVRGIARLRDATRPWLALVVLVLAWTLAARTDGHELAWAEQGGQHGIGFGGLWFAYVARPIYLLLVGVWLWRLALLALLLARIARLPLAIVPTHPDGAGGLGFLAGLPRAFAPVAFAGSAVAAARWGHLVAHHGVDALSLRLPMVGIVVLMLVLFLAPLLVFAPRLAAARRTALLEYGALVGRHGRLVQRRWIAGEPVGEPELLSAPELGPVADTLALYGAVRSMRPVPVDRGAILAIALPAALPLLAVLAIQVPLRELLSKVLSALV
jgi:hypothetical protein